jgi:1-acyl-sn-glycerol-3-phosphate acyltransferase
MGNAVGIFPEGRVTGSREVRRAGAGAALLAMETGVPLVPVGFYVEPKFVKEIKGHFHDRETVGWWQFGGKCIVNIGEPWQLAVQEKTDRSYRYLRDLTDKLMNNVQELVNQAAKSFNY